MVLLQIWWLPISMHIIKIYDTMVLERRSKIRIEEDIKEEQAAFHPGKQNQDHIHSLLFNNNKEKYWFKESFDLVPRRQIWEELKTKKVSTGIKTDIIGTNEEMVKIVRMNGELSRELIMEEGFK